MSNQEKHMEKTQNLRDVDSHKKRFSEKIAKLNALACNFTSSNLVMAEHESESGLKALGADGALQEMLAAQMLAIHQLQQTSAAMANKNFGKESGEYFLNCTLKLANTFAQQVNILGKLQGKGGQKITIERVDVHHGAQAIVGNVTGVIPMGKERKNENDLL